MRLKRLLSIAFFLLAALILAVYIVLETYDYNRLKPIITEAVKNATGRELVIDGDIGIDWGRYPGIRIEAIRFQNAAWGSRADAFTAASVEIELALWPLIMGRIEIPRLLVDSPDILLETNPAGTTNLTIDTDKTESRQPAALPKQILIDELIVSDGRFEYRQGTPNPKLILALDRIETAIDLENNQVALSLKGLFQQAPFQIKGFLDRPLPAIISGKPLAADFRIQLAQTEMTVAGRLEDPTRLKGLDFELGASGPSLPATLALAGISGLPDLGAFRLEAHLTGSAEAAAVDGFAFQIGTDDTAKVAISGRVGNLQSGMGTDLVISIQGKDLGSLEEILGTRLPSYDSFAIKARLRQTEVKQFHLTELDLAVGERSDLSADLTLDLRQSRPLLSGRVDSRRIDLVPLFAGTDRGSKNEVQGRASETSLETASREIGVDDLLEAVDADLILNTGDVSLPWMKLTEMQTRARLQNGVVQFAMQGPALPDLETLTGLTRMDQLGPFQISGTLRPEAHRMVAEDLHLKSGKPGAVEVAVTGTITDLPGASGFDFGFVLQGNNAAALGRYIVEPWPLKGPFRLTGRMLARNTDLFRFVNLKGTLNDIGFSGNVEVSVSGQVPYVLTAVTAPRFNLRPLALPNLTLPDSVLEMNDLGPLAAEIKIGVPEGPVGFETVRIQAGTPELIETHLRGRVTDIENLKGVDLHLTARGSGLENFETIVGESIPIRGPYSLDVTFSDSAPGTYQFSPMIITIGSQALTGDMTFDPTAKRPKLSASIQAETFDLKPVLPRTTGHPALKKHLSETILEDRLILPQWPLPPLPILDKDVQLDIDIGQLKAPRLTINELGCHFEMANGKIVVRAGGRPQAEFEKLANISDRLEIGKVDLLVQGTADKKRLGVDAFRLNAGDPDKLEVKVAGKAHDIVRQEGLDIDFIIQGQNANTLDNFITLHKPLEGPFRLSGHLVDPELKAYRLSDVDLTIGNSDLSGWVNINLAPQRPRIDAAFSSRQLDLRPFVGYADLEQIKAPESEAQKKEIPALKPKSKPQKMFSEEPLPMDWLERLDLHFDFECKELYSKWAAINDLKLELELEDGDLTLEPLRFTLGEGPVNGRLKLETRDGAKIATVFLGVADYDIGKELSKLGLQRQIEGNLDAKIDVTGPAASTAAFMGQLNGRITVSLEDGRVLEKYIGLLYSDLRSTLLGLIDPFGRKNQFIDLNCTVHTFQVQNGIANYAGVLDTAQTTVFGAGSVDLRTERLAITLKSDPKKGIKVGRLGRIGFSLSDLTKPFKLGGTLAQPSLAVDPAGTVFAFGKILGSLALGPAGIPLILTDVSLGTDNPCAKALLEAQKDLKKK